MHYIFIYSLKATIFVRFKRRTPQQRDWWFFNISHVRPRTVDNNCGIKIPC